MKKLDRRFINISLVVEKIANAPDANPTAGIQYIVGAAGTGAFNAQVEGTIAQYNGTAWDFTTPSIEGMEVLNKETGDILKWNGTSWAAVTNVLTSDRIGSTIDEKLSTIHNIKIVRSVVAFTVGNDIPNINPKVGQFYISSSNDEFCYLHTCDKDGVWDNNSIIDLADNSTYDGTYYFCFPHDMRQLIQYKNDAGDPRCRLVAGIEPEDGVEVFKGYTDKYGKILANCS